MSASEPTQAVKLFGTESLDPAGRNLRAGPLSAVLDNGMLRYIRVGDIEVMRAIAFLVRDENWGTFAPEIANLTVTEDGASFTIGYEARCRDAKRSIAYRADIQCHPDGKLIFSVTASPESDFLTNRTGFVVLHPLQGVAGQPLEIEHADGRKVRSQFPAIIDPDCPFRNIRALTHEVQSGLSVTCRMEGYAFEMEDHRNWTDASFKTYVRPLAEPWPYTLPVGVPFTQSVMLTFSGALPAPAVHTGVRPVGIELGSASTTRMPAIGLGLPAEEAAPALAVANLIRSAGIRTLLAQFDGRRGDVAETAAHVARLSAATGAAITAEIIVPGKGTTADELAPIVAALAAANLMPAAVMVSPAPHLKAVLPGSKGPEVPSYQAMFAATRAAFPGAALGGGMFSYFTELNRNKPPAELLDFISHTTCPIVHAADDVSVMETLEALPYVIQSTRAMAKGKPYHVGPSAIPARDNPYGAATAGNPANGRVCLARMDPRQRGLFGAAWTLGYIAAFAKGGIDQVCIGSPTGPSGIIARTTDYPQPYYDTAQPSAVYPVYHVVAGMAAAAGAQRLEADCSRSADVAVLAYQGHGAPVLWLANLTGQDRQVALPAFGGQSLRIRSLDTASFAEATRRPDFLSDAGVTQAPGLPLRLAPYAVAIVTAA